MARPSQRLCSILLTAACLVAAQQEMYCGDDVCYDILGVTRDDDTATIKKAYRKLSMQWHPDKNLDNKDEATKKFQGIATAYEVLSDDSMRAAYDYFLDHPEEHMYNRMRYYRAVYAPKTPIWAILFFGSLIITGLQMFHYREQAKLFLASPMLEEMTEQYYMDNCAGGLHGYQTGELTPEKKASLKEEFMTQLYADKSCPLSFPKWSNTLFPCLVYFWPVNGTKWLIWRIVNHKEIEAEKKRVREEKARIEREEREERERIAAELAAKEAKKEAGKRAVAEREAAEEAKRAKWMAELEAEEAEQEEEEETELVVTGKVTAVDEMKKKGHALVEVSYGNNKTAQLVVVNKTIDFGQEVTIALEGGTGPDGKTVKRSKIGGEWSEAALLSLGGAEGGGGDAKPAAKEEDGDSEAEEAARMFAQAQKAGKEDDEEDGKARKRKNKKGKS